MTQELVKSVFDYKDGFLLWKDCIGRKTIPGVKAGSIDKRPGQHRRFVIVKRKRYSCARLIFLWHNGYFPETVDHIDRNSLNDNIENLRAATRSQNNRNMGSRKNSSSRYLGVNYHVLKNKWQAQIQDNYKQKYLGSFDTEKEAGLAYNKAAKEIHGEFANLNIIE